MPCHAMPCHTLHAGNMNIYTNTHRYIYTYTYYIYRCIHIYIYTAMLWLEEILHHLVDGLSGYDPIISRCFIGIPIVAPTGAGFRKHPQYILYIYIYTLWIHIDVQTHSGCERRSHGGGHVLLGHHLLGGDNGNSGIYISIYLSIYLSMYVCRTTGYVLT